MRNKNYKLQKEIVYIKLIIIYNNRTNEGINFVI
jgi:hypothetical protein